MNEDLFLQIAENQWIAIKNIDSVVYNSMLHKFTLGVMENENEYHCYVIEKEYETLIRHLLGKYAIRKQIWE